MATPTIVPLLAKTSICPHNVPTGTPASSIIAVIDQSHQNHQSLMSSKRPGYGEYLLLQLGPNHQGEYQEDLSKLAVSLLNSELLRDYFFFFYTEITLLKKNMRKNPLKSSFALTG